MVRATAAALVCIVTAAIGHQSAGGTIPTAVVVAAFAGSVLVAWLLSARRITAGQLAGLLILCQVCVHLACSTDEMSMSVGMIAAHLAATVVSATLLARGEALVWHLAERLGLRGLPIVLHSASNPFWSPLTPVPATRSLRDVRLRHTRVERGPPSGCS